MDPLTAGIAGGANLLGSIFSSTTSASNTEAQIQAQQQMQQQSQAFNANQAQITRDYQTQMSNSAYQRASTDMKAAGLNPMMMANGSMNASSPSGATASTSTPTPPLSQNRGALSGIGDAVSKGIDAAVSAKTMEKMADEIANLKATKESIIATTSATEARRDLTRQEERTEQHETERRESQALSAKYATAGHQWEALGHKDLLENIPDYARVTGNVGAWGGGKFGDTVGPIISSALGVKRMLPKSITTETSRQHGNGFDDLWSRRISN
ncbi:MAG: DNA pilot protein [Microvirus sp.]|nr:MAG: DNA pilot protein [Microvirus sp.]